MIKQILTYLLLTLFLTVTTVNAAVSFVDSASNTASSGTAISVTHGFTSQANDIIIAIMHGNLTTPRFADDNGADAFTEEIDDAHPGGETSHYAIFWRRVPDGSDPSSYNFTQDNSADWTIIVIQMRGGIEAGNPFDVAPSATPNSGTGTTATATGVTINTAGAMSIAYTATDGTPSYSAWAGDSYTTRETIETNINLKASTKPHASSGAQSAVTWTLGSNDWFAEIFAIKPEPAVGGSILNVHHQRRLIMQGDGY